jgi:hypothetical protein
MGKVGATGLSVLMDATHALNTKMAVAAFALLWPALLSSQQLLQIDGAA